jgi:hypothetical protein
VSGGSRFYCDRDEKRTVWSNDRRLRALRIEAVQGGYAERVAARDAELLMREHERGLGDRGESHPSPQESRHDLARVDAAGKIRSGIRGQSSVQVSRREHQDVGREAIPAEMRRFPHAAGADGVQRLCDGPSAQRAARVVATVRAYEVHRRAVDLDRRTARPSVLEFRRDLRKVVDTPPRYRFSTGTSIGDPHEMAAGQRSTLVFSGPANRLETHAAFRGRGIDAMRHFRIAATFD